MPRVTLQQLLEQYEKERLTEDDFRAALIAIGEALDERMKGDKDELTDAMKLIAGQFSSLRADIEANASESGKNLSRAVQDEISSLSAKIKDLAQKVEAALDDQQNGMNYIYDKVASLKNGKDAKPEAVVGIVLERISGSLGRIDELAEDVEELKKSSDEDRKRNRATIPAVTPVGGRNLVRTADISPDLDGNTKTFNIGAFHSILQVVSSSFPHALRSTIDYTWNANTGTITFTDEIDASTVLSQGQTVRILIVTA